jgi:hypothetical protein
LQLRVLLLVSCLVVVGMGLLLYAFARPAPARFVAAVVVLGAAAFVRARGRHRQQMASYGRAEELRSLGWSLAAIVAIVGVSLLFAHPWTN